MADEHKHEHKSEHAHSHDQDHAHEHGHSHAHEHEHTHVPDHSHEHDAQHSHEHDHEHDAQHAHDHEHAHDPKTRFHDPAHAAEFDRRAFAGIRSSLAEKLIEMLALKADELILDLATGTGRVARP